MKIDIIKIGNSKGIRLPKAVIEQCGFGEHLEMEVRGGEVVLRAAKRNPREGWDEAFAAALARDGSLDAPLLLGDFPNEFDENEWTWPDLGQPGESERS
jgi:antitoxin MazE